MKHLLLFIINVSPFYLGAQLPRVFVFDAEKLSQIKMRKDPALVPQIEQLEKQADSLLNMKPVSVIEKAFLPESGNKHDYMSQAPYFWYDSSKPNGRPYLRRDGERNPEIYKITDRTYLGNLETATRTLALAWYFTGREQYATKAATLLRVWFLDVETRMDPNLDFGQAVPGVNTGRGIGIIETIALTGIADAAGLIEGSRSWTTADAKGLQQWYAAYLQWMLTSKNGLEEKAAKNNHGTWYYAQAIDFALFTSQLELAKRLVNESKAKLDSQLTVEGKQPLELERTNGLGYSSMNLNGWFTVAKLAAKTGIDLWHYQTSKGAGIQRAFDWLLPYAFGDANWPYQQISKYNARTEFYPLLSEAAVVYKDARYTARLSGKMTDFIDTLK